jgi:iron complex transport system permease protein
MKYRIHFFLLFSAFALVLISVLHLFVGQISLSFADFSAAFFKNTPLSTNELLMREFRIPRLIMAIVGGGGLALAGMLMQTLFNNPLAGPYVLGINSGSSLLVALSTLTGFTFLGTQLNIVFAAIVGAFIFGMIILLFSLSVKSHISLLLIGLMLGSFTFAVVSILELSAAAEQFKSFAVWGMGSLQQVEMSQVPLILLFFLGSVLSSFLLIKPLNMLVLGEDSAVMLGLSLRKTRILIISVTALFTGLITAYCGPIAFVGLAVPNITKLLFRTQQHAWLIGGNLIIGALFLVSCDVLIQYLEETVHLPLNALTSIIGAPFVIFILIKKVT